MITACSENIPFPSGQLHGNITAIPEDWTEVASAGVIELETKNVSVMNKQWNYIISVPWNHKYRHQRGRSKLLMYAKAMLNVSVPMYIPFCICIHIYIYTVQIIHHNRHFRRSQ